MLLHSIKIYIKMVYSSYAWLILFKFLIYNTVNPSITRFVRFVFYQNCTEQNLKYRNSMIEKYMLHEGYLLIHAMYCISPTYVVGGHVFRNILKGLILS